MPQNADKVIDHEMLFREPEYQKLFADKKEQFEFNHAEVKIDEIRNWTKSKDYLDKNFAREALTVNPAKACQPLGAVFVANGFAKTLSFVHGSQGCVAYYRSHFSRHFKEPTSCVSSSMTEDAAVFGGLNNMVDGLANSYNLYKPDMIAVSTTCMAEVIGDDLNAFIKTSKEKGSVPADFDVPFAHTPAFVGATSPATTTRCWACCSTSGMARPGPRPSWSACPTSRSTSSAPSTASWSATCAKSSASSACSAPR